MVMDELNKELLYLLEKWCFKHTSFLELYDDYVYILDFIGEFNWFKGKLDFYLRHEQSIISVATDMGFDFDGYIKSSLEYYMNAIFNDVIEEICQKLVSEWKK
jgi:hypothetical protein